MKAITTEMIRISGEIIQIDDDPEYNMTHMGRQASLATDLANLILNEEIFGDDIPQPQEQPHK
jgi:hypothetical protein